MDSAGIPETSFSVFRLRRDILRRSDVGVIATHRTTSLTAGADANSLFGVDGNFAFYQNLRLNGFYAVSRTPPTEGNESGSFDDDASSYSGKFDYAADRYGLTFEHLKVGQDFKPELGFLRREAFRRNYTQARFSPRPRSIDWMRRLVLESELDYITPRTFVSSLVQFNSSSDSFSASVRFRWEYEPGSDVFLVYSEGRNELSGEPFLATRGLAVKLTKLFRF